MQFLFVTALHERLGSHIERLQPCSCSTVQLSLLYIPLQLYSSAGAYMIWTRFYMLWERLLCIHVSLSFIASCEW